jgi:hypothetical protein
MCPNRCAPADRINFSDSTSAADQWIRRSKSDCLAIARGVIKYNDAALQELGDNGQCPNTSIWEFPCKVFVLFKSIKDIDCDTTTLPNSLFCENLQITQEKQTERIVTPIFNLKNLQNQPNVSFGLYLVYLLTVPPNHGEMLYRWRCCWQTAAE